MSMMVMSGMVMMVMMMMRVFDVYIWSPPVSHPVRPFGNECDLLMN